MRVTESDIQRRAYELWEAADRTGSADFHWCQAERELLQGSEPSVGGSLPEVLNQAMATNEPPAPRDGMLASAPEVHELGEPPTALCKTAEESVKTPAARVRASLLEFIGSTPRSWPWRLSPSRY